MNNTISQSTPFIGETIVKSKYINKNATAYQYATGVVQINEMRYMGYSITDAIRKYRQSNK